MRQGLAAGGVDPALVAGHAAHILVVADLLFPAPFTVAIKAHQPGPGLTQVVNDLVLVHHHVDIVLRVHGHEPALVVAAVVAGCQVKIRRAQHLALRAEGDQERILAPVQAIAGVHVDAGAGHQDGAAAVHGHVIQPGDLVGAGIGLVQVGGNPFGFDRGNTGGQDKGRQCGQPGVAVFAFHDKALP